MKKIILTAVVLFTVAFASAQDKKESTGEGFSNGDVFVTGSFGIDSTNDKNTNVKTNGFEFTPSVGYFFSDNVALGLRIGYSNDKTENSGTTVVDNDQLTAGVFGRYYFTPASKFSVFTELGFAYVTAKDNIAPTAKANGFGLGLGLGINYFVSNNWSLVANYAGLTYVTAKADFPGAQNVTGFNIGADLDAITFGLNYKF